MLRTAHNHETEVAVYVYSYFHKFKLNFAIWYLVVCSFAFVVGNGYNTLTSMYTH